MTNTNKTIGDLAKKNYSDYHNQNDYSEFANAVDAELTSNQSLRDKILEESKNGKKSYEFSYNLVNYYPAHYSIEYPDENATRCHFEPLKPNAIVETFWKLSRVKNYDHSKMNFATNKLTEKNHNLRFTSYFAESHFNDKKKILSLKFEW